MSLSIASYENKPVPNIFLQVYSIKFRLVQIQRISRLGFILALMVIIFYFIENIIGKVEMLKMWIFLLFSQGFERLLKIHDYQTIIINPQGERVCKVLLQDYSERDIIFS